MGLFIIHAEARCYCHRGSVADTLQASETVFIDVDAPKLAIQGTDSERHRL